MKTATNAVAALNELLASVDDDTSDRERLQKMMAYRAQYRSQMDPALAETISEGIDKLHARLDRMERLNALLRESDSARDAFREALAENPGLFDSREESLLQMAERLAERLDKGF